MIYETMGIDQQKPATGITGIFIDTDADKAAKALNRAIMLNPEYYEMTAVMQPRQFIIDIVTVMKNNNLVLALDNAQKIQLALLRGYPDRYTRVDWLDLYINTLIGLARDGVVSASISQPAGYVEEKINWAGIGKAYQRGTINIALIAVLGVAAYAFFSKGLPGLIKK